MKLKSIVIDDGLASRGPAAGVGNYSLCLYSGLKEYFSDDSTEVNLRRYSLVKKCPSHLRRLMYLLHVNTPVHHLGSRLVHYTNYYAPLIRYNRKTKYVVTIHDMAAWTVPDAFSKEYLRFIKPIIRRTAGLSDAIITVSQTVKNEIVRYLQVSEERVHVCYNTSKLVKGREYDISEACILFVGNIDVHKNIITLIKAFAKLKEKNKYEKTKLVLAGQKRAGFKEVETLIKKFGIKDRVLIPGYVEENQLMKFYGEAKALVMPSIYEGFGIPVIEAMRCNVPVIASDIPVFREIAGEAALFYGDPLRDDLLSDAMQMVLSSQKLRNELISRGCEQAQLYSKENFINRHVEVYEELMRK